MIRKLIVNDGRTERELLLVGTMVVGRDPACDISDRGDLLSRRHAEFAVAANGVSVRDLNSRNGILVNGSKVMDAALRSGDVVQIGHLSVRLLEAVAAAATPAEDESDATMVMAPPRAQAPAAPPPAAVVAAPPVAAPPVDDAGDKTQFFAPPPPKSAPPASDAGDKTQFIARPPVVAPKPAAAPVSDTSRATARAVSDTATTATSATTATTVTTAAQPAAAAPAVSDTATRATARTAQQPWSRFVLMYVAILAALVFLSLLVPMSLWQTRVLNATAESRASALVHWLAASAAAAADTGAPMTTVADAVGREPGVVSALVLSTDGRVLAPASRSDETIATIPGSNAKPADVARLREGWNGSLFEAAIPVESKGRRAAIAWITFRPAVPAEAGNGAVVLTLPILVALVATYLVAQLITRRTLRALTALNEDVELAVGGKLDTIADPLGAKPVKDLADALNYLVAKLRTAAGPPAGRTERIAARAASTAAAAPVEASASPFSTPAAALARLEATLVANAQFRITDASPSCADLIGVRPDALIGEHLIDAIPDREIADAVMTCLSAIRQSGEERTVVAPGGRPYEIAIAVARSGRDQPIRVTLTAERAGA